MRKSGSAECVQAVVVVSVAVVVVVVVNGDRDGQWTGFMRIQDTCISDTRKQSRQRTSQEKDSSQVLSLGHSR